MAASFHRPDPDVLLARVNASEAQHSRGKLKIFLGYVAGVGKTFTMLEAARQRKVEGQDVAVGYVETHHRPETDALLEGLEIIPRRILEYRGISLSEMDLDAILARHPQIVLVDELAHSNAPGSRHPKRYLDVEELLSAGIDVYTTVNIQHLESLNDVVRQITTVTVHETVPDRLLDEAHDIELVDLPPDELQKRLRDGKVYVPDQAARAMEKFFRTGNLTALRELALRRAAHRVDTQMVDYMQRESISGPWAAGERILVAVSSHPMGEHLIRTGRRLADDLSADWFVMFVETPGHLQMPPENRLRVQRYLRLAEELGATVVNVAGESVAKVMLEFARERNITKIVAGKPLRPRWFELFRGSVIDQIIRSSGKIDVYVVSEESEVPTTASILPRPSRRSPWRYLFSLGVVALFALAGVPLSQILAPANLVMLFLAAVVIVAVYLGRGPAILASLVSVLVFDYFFIDPRLSFSVSDTQYLLTFAGLLVVGIISNSAALLRDQVDALRLRDRQTQALHMLSRELTGDISLEQVLATVLRNLEETFHRPVTILLPADLPDRPVLRVRAASAGLEVDENEMAVAEWCFRNGDPAGRGTNTLPAASIRFIPLKTVRGTVGVLGIKPLDPDSALSYDQRVLISGFANLAALAIERAAFAEKAAQSEMLRTTEKLQTALLNSISHELRTPLASITGVLSSLGESEREPEGAAPLDAGTRLELIESASSQAGRLNRLVENLLDMTRLEAGALRLHLQPVELPDLLGSVLHQDADRLGGHLVDLRLPDSLPLVRADPVLIAQVLSNLLDNACKYSPPGSPIQIEAKLVENQVEVCVQDEGVGIPPHDLGRIFDKFYRVQHSDKVAGTGLGLSICKGIIEAHGGKIWAVNNPLKGASFNFTLPVQEDSGSAQGQGGQL